MILPMHSTRVFGLALSLTAGAILSLTPGAFAVDQVTRRSDNVTLRGEFTAMTTESITIKLTGGREETVSVADIRTLRFDQEPTLLAQAQSNERSGALDAALTKYEQVQSEYNGSDKRLVTDLAYLIARTKCRLSLADPNLRADARTAIQQFRTANRSNFRYLEGTLLEAAVAAADGDQAGARSLLQEVQTSTVKGFQLQAGVQLGELLLAAGETSEAAQAFDAVIQQSQGDSSAAAAHWAGLLGRARCAQADNQLDDAITRIEQVIAGASQAQTDVLADAWVLKGDCLRLRNEQKAALMAYLHVDVLYPSEPNQHAQSLYRLAQLWGPAGHQDRAEDAAARLTDRYPNSEWAGMLRQGG